MSGFTNIFGRLRRHRASVGRSVWVLFALASLSAGAAPCFAMTGSSGPIAQHDGTHAVAASSHDHSRAAGHEHGTSTDPSERSPSSCPHCPLAVVMSGQATSAHSLCSAADDASDGGSPSASPAPFKHVASTATVELLPVDREPRQASRKPPPVEARAPSLALNLLHCVLLI